VIHRTSSRKQRVPASIIFTQDVARMVACALTDSCLDYATSVLYGTTQKIISKLQRAQSLLARVVTGSFQCSSHNLLERLHWLPTEYRVNFKIANITFHSPLLSTCLLCPRPRGTISKLLCVCLSRPMSGSIDCDITHHHIA